MKFENYFILSTKGNCTERTETERTGEYIYRSRAFNAQSSGHYNLISFKAIIFVSRKLVSTSVEQYSTYGQTTLTFLKLGVSNFNFILLGS